MPKFRVALQRRQSANIEVSAATFEEAADLALERVAKPRNRAVKQDTPWAVTAIEERVTDWKTVQDPIAEAHRPRGNTD